ncbi:MAG: RNA 3'-phosphate cyclase [Chloroflexi bacterium]|nr:RNA 3'-phosphate cyclase [Chloroflexota bacterium]
MLVLDGSAHSGSGTIVRFGVTLAALAGRELRLTNVRAKRDPPGLRPQHLTVIQAIRELCHGDLAGAAVGSHEIVFRPGPLPRGGSFVWDIGTAGSTTMLALALLPIAAFAAGPSSFRLVGGLFQDFAPSAFHLQHALLPLLSRMGLSADLDIVRPGYVPAGAGVIELNVEPIKGELRPLHLPAPGDLQRVWGIALASHLRERQVSRRLAEECRRVLRDRGVEADIEAREDESAAQPGACLAIFGKSTTDALLGADLAGAPRRSSETIGKSVARMFLEDLTSGATVDRHLADQLIIFAALAGGTSELIIPTATDHVLANLWLVETILGARSSLDGQRLRIEGVGYGQKS